ncbi:MAG: hypothetical protein IOC52_10415 [Methylobacterium sp.]|nr:hypothetical protein [Methylobacterium sp.]
MSDWLSRLVSRAMGEPAPGASITPVEAPEQGLEQAAEIPPPAPQPSMAIPSPAAPGPAMAHAPVKVPPAPADPPKRSLAPPEPEAPQRALPPGASPENTPSAPRAAARAAEPDGSEPARAAPARIPMEPHGEPLAASPPIREVDGPEPAGEGARGEALMIERIVEALERPLAPPRETAPPATPLVRIGRIDIRVASPPAPAPSGPPRAQGFAGYARLRQAQER